jgi:glycosyltransferase involved in cell wall biosynthesis
MELYARELETALHSQLGDGERVNAVRPGRPLGSRIRLPGRLRKAPLYLDRYVAYQWQARGQAFDVHHIVDPAYAHLGWSLDRRRTLVTFHDAVLLKLAAGDFSTAWRPRKTIAMFKTSLRVMRSAARVITDSASGRDELLRFVDYDPRRIVVIPLAVSDQFRPGLTANRRQAGSGPFRILHVGHCGFYKNIETIIRALPLIDRMLGEPVLFVKAGGVFTRGQLELVRALNVQDQVEHLGHLADEQLPSVYAGCDLLLMPSLHEGFGLPVLEAMATGIPVVASPRGSLPEVVGDAALVIEPEDPVAIAEAVTKVLTNGSLRDAMVRRGTDWAARFTWERTAAATLEVYRAIHDEVGSHEKPAV